MIQTFVEIPETLHTSIQQYLDKHPDWDSDRVYQAALSLFLMQNSSDSNAARTYLDTLFAA
jgi:hypothetical protein